MALDPTVIPNLNAAVAGYAKTLATIATDPAGPYTTYTVGDQSFDWTQYQDFLNRQIVAVQKTIQALSPFQLMTAVRT